MTLQFWLTMAVSVYLVSSIDSTAPTSSSDSAPDSTAGIVTSQKWNIQDSLTLSTL